MGWNPAGIESKSEVKMKKEGEFDYIYIPPNTMTGTYFAMILSLRDLVSIESGFRKFVVENELTLDDYLHWTILLDLIPVNIETTEYRLMLSSIQTDIEKFILDNVLIPNVLIPNE